MKKILMLLSLIFTVLTSAQAQKADGSIKGRLQDTVGKQPISDATVSVLGSTDSTLKNFTLSGKTGNFEVKGLTEGEYKLVITSRDMWNSRKNSALRQITRSLTWVH